MIKIINGCEVTLIFPKHSKSHTIETVKDILSAAYGDRIEKEVESQKKP